MLFAGAIFYRDVLYQQIAYFIIFYFLYVSVNTAINILILAAVFHGILVASQALHLSVIN